MRWNPRWPVWAKFAPGRKIASLLLVTYAGLALSSSFGKSTTFDEIAHLTAGYSYWVTHDYRLNPENGILPQRWAALPLLAGDFEFPSLDLTGWWGSEVFFQVGPQFFYTLGNDVEVMLWRGRCMIVVLGVLLAGLVYVWARRLFGARGGIIALALFAFSPTALAHGRLITSDMAAALFFTASVGCFWTTLHRANLVRLLISALVMGGLFVSKMSAPLIVPIVLLLLLIRCLAGRPWIVDFGRSRRICGRWRLLRLGGLLVVAHMVVVVCVIWLFFGFRYTAFNHWQPNRDRMESGDTIETLTEELALGPAIRQARNCRVLPEAYLHGFAFALHHARARRGFLNGQYRLEGWPYFFPYCVLVKTPLPIFAMLGLAAISTAAHWGWGSAFRSNGARSVVRGSRGLRGRRIGRGLYRTAPLWVLLAVYWLVAIRSHINIGHRHVLPTYPAMFILAGASAAWCKSPRRFMPVAVVGLLLLLAVESIRIWPHYLAYFNQVIGGSKYGYRHLVDSSLDWGQDLPGLKKWLDDQGLSDHSEGRVYLSYFGTGNPDYYSIEARPLPGYGVWRRPDDEELAGGVYCISATMLQSLYTTLAVGHWAPPYETVYQQWKSELKELAQTRQQFSPAELERWNELRESFGFLRFARLCAFLRQRVPDHQVGYSILIYRLTDQDIDRALNGPPAELASQIPENRAEAHNNLGVTLASQNRLEEAMVQFRDALDTRRGYAEAHSNLATALHAKGNVNEAIDHYRQALQAGPGNPKVHYNLGITLGLIGQADEALKHFREAMRLRDDWPQPMAAAAWILASRSGIELADSAEAVRLALRAVQITGHRDAKLLSTLATAYAATGQFDRALRVVETAVELGQSEFPDDATAAAIREQLKRYQAAVNASANSVEDDGTPGSNGR